MKGWEPTLPTTFPIERVHREATQEAEQRRRRRRRRSRGAMSGLCAVILMGLAVAVVNRADAPDQIRTGPATGVGARAGTVNGKIAFLRSPGPGRPAPGIYLMNEDGSGQTMIAETTGGAQLAWSPDGRRLAFTDAGGIYVVNADGSDETKVPTTTNGDQSPAWSPDGTTLAFRGVDDRSGGITVINVDGSGRRRVTTGVMDGAPAWSPDGSQIAFSSMGDIYVVSADGSGRRKLATIAGFEDYPTWSPDGRQIAFRLDSTISVVDVDGGKERALASPGGTGAVNPTGSGANKLAIGRGDPANPRWSPDGTKIVFALYQSADACSIWVMNADGGSQSQLTDGTTCDRDPAWQPLLP
jgi:Tol biopolymer transport system component